MIWELKFKKKGTICKFKSAGSCRNKIGEAILKITLNCWFYLFIFNQLSSLIICYIKFLYPG